MHKQNSCSRRLGAFSNNRRWVVAGLASTLAMFSAPKARATVLLNDSFADGTRTSTSLPTESPDYVGNNTGGSVTPSVGKLAFDPGTSNEKLWTFFTSDNSAPDNSAGHNAVTSMAVGDTLTASITFSLPNTIASSASTPSRNFVFGLFNDPTDPRVQLDTANDGGGTGSPWQDATGYVVQTYFDAVKPSANTLFALGKRTTSNTGFMGSSSSFTVASPSGGTSLGFANNTSYTYQLALHEVSSTQMNVTISLLQGATLLSTYTASDTGTSFGGTAVGAGLLPGSQSIYTNFDQLNFRMASNAQTNEVDFTNFNITLTQAPEPGSAILAGAVTIVGLTARRRRPVLSNTR